MKHLKHIQELQQDFSKWYTFPASIKYHPDVFFNAFMMNRTLFKDAPIKIKENDELVAKILKIDGYNLNHCLPRHQKDRTMVEIALLSTPMVAKIVDPSFLNNEALLLRLAKKSGHVFAVRSGIFDKQWFEHQEIMRFAIDSSPLVFQLASDKYRSNFDNCLHACQKFHGNYIFVDSSIKNTSHELALLVVQMDSSMLKHVPEAIKEDGNFILDFQMKERG